MDEGDGTAIALFDVAGSLIGSLIICVCFDLDMTDATPFVPIAGILFASLLIIEFLCWLFHIPGWIGKGIDYIYNKTDPKGRNE